jgi:DNA-binding winged helix-turn-helix (wHTH) protein
MSLRFGPFTFDTDQRQLLRDGAEVHLTPKAFDLLALLIDASPRVVRKTELHERLWPGTFVSDATLVSLVKELRRALDDHNAQKPLIRTAHAVGYAFCGLVDRIGLPPSNITRWIVAGRRSIPLSDVETLIGRDPAAAVRLDDPGVSRRHARIVIRQDEAILEDLGSKNGTRRGEQLLSEPVALQDGDRIQVGPIVLIYRASVADTAPENWVAPFLPPK